MRTLSEMVAAALEDASTTKLAGREFLPQQDDGFDTFLAQQLGQAEPSTVEVKVASAEPEQIPGIVDDASFALKLAEALDLGATTLAKLAEQSESPAVVQQNNTSLTQSPTAQAGAKAKANATPRHVGPQGKIPTDAGVPSSEGGPSNHPGKVATDRAAVERLLGAKIAEHEMLRSIGQVQAAQEVLKEAQDLQQKIADSVDYPNNPPVSSGEATGSHIPDNQGLINMTKGQARNANTRQVAQFISEPPKHDNAVAAHLSNTHGLKLSSILKRAEEECEGEESKKEKDKDKKASVLSSADSALKGLGNKVLGGIRAGGRAALRASEEGRVAASGAPATLKNKAMSLVNKAGRSASQIGSTDAAKRIAGGATIGAGALGAGAGVHALAGRGDK